MQIFADKLFENPLNIITAFDNEGFVEAFSQIEDLRKRFYLLGYVRYEAKEIFLGRKIKSKLPLLYFEVFEKSGEFCLQNSPAEPFLLPETTVCYRDYKRAIDKIKRQIAKGNTYQVNYTYDWLLGSEVPGFDLYRSILPKQTTPYNAYIKNKWEEILSFSPELFFELNGNVIRTKPMKGTVKRGVDKKEDDKNIEFLKNDIKNRAENVMIVDLLRNDLGKIAKTGSVKVDKLFEIETHKTVHQMTSEIRAEIKENTTLYEIFEAIFPCGSVTGAPKISTMDIIDKIESGNRRVYCGAIGLISPAKCIFSVPIRILQRENGEKLYKYRVGGAVVWDSTAKEEWAETLTKTAFLHPDFKIIETVSVKNGRILNKSAHFARMKKSAEKLGFVFNPKIIKIMPEKDGILRILLARDGTFETQHRDFDEIKSNKITVSKVPVNSCEMLLYHKTTYRPWYEKSFERINAGDIFDEIFVNEKGELTEGSRSNIFVKSGGKLYTPPIKCGLLNGIMRQKMSKNFVEKKLDINDLESAEKVYCANSVRGLVEVEVDFN